MQKIYLYCVKRLENTAVAEDVASDIILELLRSYGSPKTLEELSLENGFVSVKDGSLCPEFATISYADYESIKDKLINGIIELAKLIAEHRDMAGDELRKKTPTAIQGANEVGAIVSMWSMLEAMVSVVLEDGYMTKGDSQNLTAFYFETENE